LDKARRAAIRQSCIRRAAPLFYLFSFKMAMLRIGVLRLSDGGLRPYPTYHQFYFGVVGWFHFYIASNQKYAYNPAIFDWLKV
jgi:hypothetical protein